ncbi:lytic murein transglycosylase [Phyllobacterium salinisoli]|uniref:Lytic murein transglycosylase n=1 Tax=Phyllobacterium salinisoli TaxID=1899321 RepID=A0A368K2B9_9HYPH|nr:lytic murein transglycosylase [Phyllobacterium salinisoli]
METLSAPFCPAGHLPREGGDWPIRPSPSVPKHLRFLPNLHESVISPLAGEMAGRPEGGTVPPAIPVKIEIL